MLRLRVTSKESRNLCIVIYRRLDFPILQKTNWIVLIHEAIRKPDSHEVALDSDGNEFVELDFEVCEHTGIAIRGVYDTDDNFKSRLLLSLL